MAKQTGLGDRLFVAGYNLSGDITAIGNVGGGPAAMECTGIDKSAFERLGGKRDGRLEATSWFNPGPEADAAHQVYSKLPTTDQVVTYCRGAALGSSAACLIGKQTNYDGSRGDDGAFSFAIATQASAGVPLEWGELATAGIREDTEATNGDGIDGGASTTTGLVAYLHVFAFTGTSVTVKLQQSSDDGDSDTYADVTGGAFTAATAVTAERIVTAADQTVERYLRVVTTGTFSVANFAVVLLRPQIERDY